MKVYDSNNLRNVAILGHSGCGKSNLIDALAYTTNISKKMPKLSDKVNMTYSIGLAPIEYNGIKYNLLDTPGYFDFSGEVISSLRASDAAIIVIDATSPIQVGTEKSLELTENMPKIMFINKIDNEKARYKDAIEMLREKYDNKIVPMISPIYKDKKFVKLHNVLENLDDDLDGEFKEQVSSVKEALMEHIAETDDEVLDKYFNGEELSPQEIQKGIIIGIQSGDIIPVICGSTINNIGSEEILKTIGAYIQPKAIEKEKSLRALVFKTMVDPFIGKMSYIKVVEGQIKKDTEIVNVNKDVKEKITNLYTMKNGELEEVDYANAGDIVIVTKMNSLKTGNTLAERSGVSLLEEIDLPKPQIYFSVVPKNKGEEDKIGSSLNKISEEDPTIHWYRNAETKQTLVGGQGELHINTVKNKLKEKFGVDVDLEDIKVAYRETIKSSSDVQGKHKKQSGGHGQYGDVKIKFTRCSDDFEFAEEIFGGSVPKSYIPAVEKGLKDSMQKGILAGYPVTNIKATLYDGSYHDVDSSEMAFKMAASIAFKKGMEEAQPILLEPIMKLTITVPEEYMGDVMGDINKRRGKILGMEPDDKGRQVIYAEAPQSETFKYAIDLRSMTQGRGFFEMELAKYNEVPQQLASKIIAEANN
ncbi:MULTISPECIES: elongation factor G [Terrisporobacter]|uniref:Elongation factor G n=2 Tax=Terrisporobacter TaxID=1505652 RepID=A0A0B3VVG1_9FIRM|nr:MULTISPECIES: elongation factor G [Terrisporobacter]KHS56604.1 elongation factor G [Terrisporobacter othiniensis]MCC3671457.1 elongation factor G [Terrisporobacter mayombei]MCR1824010.1 elongation factor G [Terrisporobacter muris]MDU6986375.1 elongation factor G [Terrisporobacter othiniensis]MDY3372094.1 elongation factor G [Terrisporobacter othiniensis]